MGLFLEDPLDVPWPVVEYLAEPLEMKDTSCVKQYTERSRTAYEHAKFRTFPHGRAWTHAEGPQALFNQATRVAAAEPGGCGGTGCCCRA
nr:DUF4158 domain-containing protein [Streptomyces smyrnaeus]